IPARIVTSREGARNWVCRGLGATAGVDWSTSTEPGSCGYPDCGGCGRPVHWAGNTDSENPDGLNRSVARESVQIAVARNPGQRSDRFLSCLFSLTFDYKSRPPGRIVGISDKWVRKGR